MYQFRQCLIPVWIVCIVVPSTIGTAGETKSADEFEHFEKQVRPLLVKHCYACHSSRAKKREGGLTLDTKAGWTTGGDNGAAIVPGDVEGSLLIRAVRYNDPDLQMPPDRALAPEALAALEQWVRMGAPDPRDKAAAQPGSDVDPSDPVAGREHWAFRPLSQAAAPEVKAREWPRRASDTFVLAQLEEAGLQPAPDADRRTLLRRTYYLLTGLPPSPQDVEAFLLDERESAFERVVDRLLSSPQFGRHWGRHWLDLARYADSNGLDENFLFREAWRYRNWVIDAVNADMPFDEFLRQQIAGDLLPYETIEQRDRQRIAAGFLVIGPKVLLGNDPRERIMDVADEQIDTIGKAVLGQTLGCARCHDHKFDPIPTADYYALAGIMTSTTVMETRYMLGQQRTMERLVGLGADGQASDEAYETYWRERSKLVENAKQGKAARELLEKHDETALKELAAKHAGVVSKAALDETLPIEDRIKAQNAQVAALEAAAKPVEIPPRAMIPSDVKSPKNEAVRLAGQFDKPGETVPRGFLHVVSASAAEIPDGQSGRLQLARWLTDIDGGAGALAARVLANRIWYHLMGRGIVRTVDNFGRTGEAPSHPELLDYLARRVVESGWSLKDLVRDIVLSRTFAMSSQHNDTAYERDPENRFLWRTHKRRLGAEALRDSLLFAAGLLNDTPLDSTVSYLGDQATAVGANENRRRTDFPCRSVYLPVIRNDLPEVFAVFDFADPHAATGMRPATLVPTQGLFLLNDASVMKFAKATADRFLQASEGAPPSELVDRMFTQILSVRPSDDERDEFLAFIRETEQLLAAEGEAEPKVRAWEIACHALFASSRFQILD